MLTDFSQPFNTGPIIDQNGDLTRFEILSTRRCSTTSSNSLYSKAGQRLYPAGKVHLRHAWLAGKDAGVEGAIMVKSSWKVINASEKAALPF